MARQITFQGMAQADFGWQSTSYFKNAIYSGLNSLGWGTASVNVDRPTELSNYVNLTIVINATNGDSQDRIRNGITNALSQGVGGVTFSRISLRVTRDTAAGKTPQEGGGGGPVYNAGNLATVTVKASDGDAKADSNGILGDLEKKDGETWEQWFERNKSTAVIGGLLLVLLLKRR